MIETASDLAALAEEWNGLAARCPGYYLSQTFQWAETAWETVARPRGRKLNCMTLRSEGRLTAVWPLVIYRDRGLRILRPLGFEGSEYCAPLVEPGDEADNRVALLWREAARSTDIAFLPHVRADSRLAVVLGNGNHWSFTEGTLAAPYVARADYSDWANYHASIGRNRRREIRRMHRRLARRGEVVVAREGTDASATLIDWMLDQKKHWLNCSNLTNDWIARPDYRDFLMALVAREDAVGGVALFAIRVDGVPVAAQLVSVDRSRVEAYFAAYDHEWSVYSPGHLITEHVLRWAFERGFDFDFRIGDEPYKYSWSRRNCDTATWLVGTSKRGIPTVVGLRARKWASRIRQKLALGRFLPSKYRRRLNS